VVRGKDQVRTRENRNADARAYETGINTLPFSTSMVVPLRDFTTIPQPRHGMKSKFFWQLVCSTWSVPDLCCSLNSLVQNATVIHFVNINWCKIAKRRGVAHTRCANGARLRNFL
jgi:hypothetical protein